MPIKHRSACSRLHVVHDNILPGIIIDCESKSVDGIYDIMENQLPKLKQKCINLMSRCTIINNCSDNCPYCSPEYTNNKFDTILMNLKLKKQH